jgi:hypothetical protein
MLLELAKDLSCCVYRERDGSGWVGFLPLRDPALTGPGWLIT